MSASSSSANRALVATVSSWHSPPSIQTTSLTTSAPEGHVRIHLLATCLHRIVRLRATGKHHTARTLPHVPGTDGVGYIPSEGDRKVYFTAPTGGSFRTVLDVPRPAVLDLPPEVSPVHAAAMVNPTLSSWMAVKQAVGPSMLPESFRAVVLGATSLSGRAAVRILRHLGAGWVAGVGRDGERLADLGAGEEAGLDERVVLQSEGTDWSELSDVDVVLDYLNGDPALELLKALKPGRGRKTWWVQIGDLAGSEMSLPSALLRSKRVLLCGSGIGAFDIKTLSEEMPDILKSLSVIPEQKVRVEKLEDVERIWESVSERAVFVP